jgi:hypothetical protein
MNPTGIGGVGRGGHRHGLVLAAVATALLLLVVAVSLHMRLAAPAAKDAPSGWAGVGQAATPGGTAAPPGEQESLLAGDEVTWTRFCGVDLPHSDVLGPHRGHGERRYGPAPPSAEPAPQARLVRVSGRRVRGPARAPVPRLVPAVPQPVARLPVVRRPVLHNEFIYKALQLTRPGGLVAVFTSRYTMDGTDNPVRERLARLADLVGAVRLPSGAHRQAAGTDVVTDLLILRRREPDREPDDTAWKDSLPMPIGDEQMPINVYFQQHPELVLGQMSAGRGAHSENDLVVEGPTDASLLLGDALDRCS